MTNEPESLIAGDTAKWSKSFADYSPNDGWSLSYTLVNSTTGANPITANAVADGQSFLVTIPAATTAALSPGTWRLIGRVAKDGEVFTVVSRTVAVSPNPAMIDNNSPLDTRTVNERILANVLTVIEERSKGAVSGWGSNGNQLTFKTDEELEKMRGLYESRVKSERAVEDRKDGRPSKRRILMRF